MGHAHSVWKTLIVSKYHIIGGTTSAGPPFFLNTLIALRKNRCRVTVSQIAKAAGFPRQEFFRYFKNINQVLPDCERWLHQEYELHLNSVPLSGTDAAINRGYFTVSFVFMAQNKEVFYQICSDMAVQDILYRMLKVLYPKLRLTWLPAGTPTPTINGERVDLYLRLLTGVICQWGKETKCDIDKAELYIRKMVKITEDVTGRNIF